MWYTTANLEVDDSQMAKYGHFKNSRWRTTAVLKIFFCYNTAADCRITVKFCSGMQFFLQNFGNGTDTGVP